MVSIGVASLSNCSQIAGQLPSSTPRGDHRKLNVMFGHESHIRSRIQTLDGPIELL